jgi:hypothetical protein
VKGSALISYWVLYSPVSSIKSSYHHIKALSTIYTYPAPRCKYIRNQVRICEMLDIIK